MQPCMKGVGEWMEGSGIRGEAIATATSQVKCLEDAQGWTSREGADLEGTRMGTEKSLPSIRGAHKQPSHSHVTSEATLPTQKQPRKQRAPGESASPSHDASPRWLRRRWPHSRHVHCCLVTSHWDLQGSAPASLPQRCSPANPKGKPDEGLDPALLTGREVHTLDGKHQWVGVSRPLPTPRITNL